MAAVSRFNNVIRPDLDGFNEAFYGPGLIAVVLLGLLLAAAFGYGVLWLIWNIAKKIFKCCTLMEAVMPIENK